MTVAGGRAWLFGFLGLALATSISAAETALGLLLLDAVIFRRKERSRTASPLEMPLLIFFVWSFAVTLLAGSAPATKAVSAQGALFFFFLAVRFWSVEENERWMRWFLVGAAVTGGFAVFQVTLGVDRYPVQDQLVVPPWLEGTPEKLLRAVALRNERAVGTRSHPLTFAEGLLVAAVLLMAIPLGRSQRWARFKWAGLPLVALGLLFSQGRGVWLGAAAAALTLALFWRRRRDVRILMAISFFCALSVVATVPKIRARALSIVTPTGGQAADRASRDVRFELWSAAWETIRAHPVTGVGIKGVKLMVEDPFLKAPRPWSETHNIFLQVAAERGVIGLGLFFWILVISFRIAWRAPRGWREGGVALLIGLVIAGLTESWIKDKEVAMMFWAAVGAIEKKRLTRLPVA